MAELRLSPADLSRASGLSEKHVRRLLSDDAEAEPRDQTKWALCDALQWAPDSIDRILAGLDPVDADASGEVSRLELLEGRFEEMEAQVTLGLEMIRTQQNDLVKMWRRLEQLQDDARVAVDDRVAALSDAVRRLSAVETELRELRRSQRQDEAGPP